MSFRNPALRRDRGVCSHDTAYKEYIPAGDELIARTLAERMRDTIAAVRGKTYTGEQSIELYPTCGTSKDYAYARHLVDPGKGRVYGFAIEWGTEFQPAWPEMELIIQDISAGLIEFCIARPCAARPDRRDARHAEPPVHRRPGGRGDRPRRGVHDPEL